MKNRGHGSMRMNSNSEKGNTQFEVLISLRRVMSIQKNALGHDIGECSCKPMTGWYRDGSCKTDEMDRGSHTVCGIVTEEFLEFALSKGNDLITPAPQYNFCLLYTSPSPRDATLSRMPSSA